jgi:hypothetical protein
MHIQRYLELDALHLEDPSLLEKPPRVIPPADVVHVIERSRYVFRGEASSQQEIPLAVGIDSRDWVSAVLTVTVDESRDMPADSAIDIWVENAFLSENEPSVVFAESGTKRAAVQIVKSDPVPNLYTEPLNTPIGPMLRVMMYPLMGTTVDVQDVTLTVTLTGRKA